MKLNKLHNALVLLLCATTVACNKAPVQNGTDPSGKTPITLSIGGVDSQDMTRAVISSDEGKTMRAFPKGSSIYMLFMANEVDGTGFKTTRTIGFAQDQDPLTNKSDISYTASDEGNVFVRYWEDAYARKTALSVAAVSTPGYGPIKAGATAGDNKTWKIGGQAGFQNIAWTSPGGGDIESSTYVDWPVGNGADATDQSATSPNFITYQDLCFSNNIGDNSDKGKTDTRIKFDTETKRFGAGTLIFNHALSKLTFRIKMGDGFTDEEFQFDAGTNIKLSNFFRSGRFIIGTGEFTQTSPNGPKIGDINKINQRSTPESGDKFTLDALVIPGTDMNTSDDAVTFYINHNEYKLTRAQLYNAILKGSTNAAYLASHAGKVDPTILAEAVAASGDGRLLRAGVHYIFTFTVSKTQVSGITAQVADWEEVTAENINPSNARIALLLDDRGTAKTDDVAFYRALNESSTIDDEYESYDWAKQYQKSTNAQYESTQWKTEWYWPSNMSFYHFRAVSPDPSSNLANDATYGDYFTLSSSDATSGSYNEIAWGAPFYNKDGATFSYSTSKGFDGTGAEAAEEASRIHQISKAIGPTDSQIKLLMFHMMSGVHFTITTSNGPKNDQVELYNESATNKRPKVQIVGYYPSGKVFIGDGHVVADGAKTTTSVAGVTCRTTATEQYGSQDYYYSAVPQTLSGATSSDPGVQLYITAPDNNQYIVNLKDILATTVSGTNITNPYQKVSTTNGTRYKIDRWYPGFQYNYTLKLTKKGIEDITATIVNWETVEADDEVQIQ